MRESFLAAEHDGCMVVENALERVQQLTASEEVVGVRETKYLHEIQFHCSNHLYLI